MLRLNLRYKLIISSLLVLMPILILLILNYRAAYDTQRNQVLADQLRVAQVVGVAVDGSFDEVMALALSYAKDPAILGLDSNRINDRLAGLQDIYPQYDSVIDVFDLNGNLIGSSHGIVKANVGDREWFQMVVRTGQPTTTNVLMSRVTGAPIAGVGVPVKDGQGRTIAVIGSNLNLDHFPNQFKTVQRAPQQNIFLADHDGILAFHTGLPNLTSDQRNVSGNAAVQAALEGKVFESDRSPSLIGGERMIVAIPTPKYGWVVGVSIPREVALAPVQESQRNSIVVFAAVFVFTTALALALSQFLLGPLRQITESAIALSHGRLTQRVKIHTGDELEELGDSFNAMVDEMQRTLRLRDEFISVASHELRTPLTVIKGYSQWLLTKENEEDHRRVMQTIVKQVDRIAELLDEMLTVTELQAGHLELHKEKMDLATLAREVVDRMQMITEKHHLLFNSNGTETVNADPNQIDVVLTNLIDNAIRYSSAGGDVEVTVSKTNDEAVISVKDYGMGIPEDKQQHVFEPFFQIQPAIAGFGGMGLGLFISKQIVDRHGGRIWFESKPGEGSTFYFSLPAITLIYSQKR